MKLPRERVQLRHGIGQFSFLCGKTSCTLLTLSYGLELEIQLQVKKSNQGKQFLLFISAGRNAECTDEHFTEMKFVIKP